MSKLIKVAELGRPFLLRRLEEDESFPVFTLMKPRISFVTHVIQENEFLVETLKIAISYQSSLLLIESAGRIVAYVDLPRLIQASALLCDRLSRSAPHNLSLVSPIS